MTMKAIERAKLAWRVLTHKPGKSMDHATRELGKGMDIELKELLLVFSSQGHSGASASITTQLLGKLLRYEPIRPLTGEPDEWKEVSKGIFQNRRCGRVFKQADRFNGQAYDIDGIIWRDLNGATFTDCDSMTPVTFPYTPESVYKAAVNNEPYG